MMLFIPSTCWERSARLRTPAWPFANHTTAMASLTTQLLRRKLCPSVINPMQTSSTISRCGPILKGHGPSLSTCHRAPLDLLSPGDRSGSLKPTQQLSPNLHTGRLTKAAPISALLSLFITPCPGRPPSPPTDTEEGLMSSTPQPSSCRELSGGICSVANPPTRFSSRIDLDETGAGLYHMRVACISPDG